METTELIDRLRQGPTAENPLNALLRDAATALEAATAAPSDTDPREVAHIECDCIPNLGPSHCHLCGERAGHPVSWAEAHPQPVQVEVTDQTALVERLRQLAESYRMDLKSPSTAAMLDDAANALSRPALAEPTDEMRLRASVAVNALNWGAAHGGDDPSIDEIVNAALSAALGGGDQ